VPSEDDVIALFRVTGSEFQCHVMHIEYTADITDIHIMHMHVLSDMTDCCTECWCNYWKRWLKYK